MEHKKTNLKKSILFQPIRMYENKKSITISRMDHPHCISFPRVQIMIFVLCWMAIVTYIRQGDNWELLVQFSLYDLLLSGARKEMNVSTVRS